jgi:DtxR family Mn-dependent transcriptional regulator
MVEQVTAVTEEYLETIYKLQEKSGVARTSDLVNMLKVVPGTVTNTVERLEKEGYVTHEPYKGVKLTEKGRKTALQVVRRHRLSERLLTDILHVKWDKVHDAACKLEHGITDEIDKPLEKALRHPKTCPHGNPIPTRCGGILEEKSQPLGLLNEREKGIVVKITDEKSDLLRYLDTLGLVPGASIEILEKAPFNGPITLKVGSTNRALSRAIASIIQVKRRE